MSRLFPVILVIILAIGASSASARRTTRTRLRPAPEAVTSPSPLITADTIATAADSTALTFAGYEKTLSSTKESFFVTNHTDSLITRLELRIDYLDMRGRQLDSRSVTVDTDLPAEATRRIDLTAWDRQKTFYYHRSPTPRAAHATPYRVTIHLLTALKTR